jgi:hypothetical protein
MNVPVETATVVGNGIDLSRQPSNEGGAKERRLNILLYNMFRR